MKRLCLSMMLLVLPAFAGEHAKQAENLLETIATWGGPLVQDNMISSVEKAVSKTGAKNGYIAYLTLASVDGGGTWACYQKDGAKGLCENDEANKRAFKSEVPESFEWEHAGVTYREFVHPVYFADYDGTLILSAVWRLGIRAEP